MYYEWKEYSGARALGFCFAICPLGWMFGIGGIFYFILKERENNG